MRWPGEDPRCLHLLVMALPFSIIIIIFPAVNATAILLGLLASCSSGTRSRKHFHQGLLLRRKVVFFSSIPAMKFASA